MKEGRSQRKSKKSKPKTTTNEKRQRKGKGHSPVLGKKLRPQQHTPGRLLSSFLEDPQARTITQDRAIVASRGSPVEKTSWLLSTVTAHTRPKSSSAHWGRYRARGEPVSLNVVSLYMSVSVAGAFVRLLHEGGQQRDLLAL